LIKKARLYRFGHMLGPHAVASIKVCDGAGDSKDLSISACRQTEALDGRRE
jgi:hypothetical protein